MRPWLLILLVVAVGCAADDMAESERPNLVLIIGDDHGYGDFGFMGSPLAQTPHLDRLAAEGTVFTTGYSTASICQPALRTLLTGLSPARFARQARRLRRGPDPDAPGIRFMATLPRLLADRGYASFQAGKYLEGSFDDGGFDEGMNDAPDANGKRKGDHLLRDGLDPVFEFIDRHRDDPFFLWFAPKLPHVPHDPPREFLRLYAKSELPLEVRTYYGAVSWFDAGVGALLDHLDERGLRERTLVVYLADNGWVEVPRPPGPSTETRNIAWMGGPRGKGSLYDPGFRTPIVFHWPGHVAAGRTIPNLVSIADVFPTLLDYAGASAPADRPGRDLRPVLEGVAEPESRTLIGNAVAVRSDIPSGEWVQPQRNSPGGFFLRTEQWHYLWYRERDDELYRIDEDPEEARDLSAEHRERILAFRDEIRRWAARAGVRVPGGRGGRSP